MAKTFTQYVEEGTIVENEFRGANLGRGVFNAALASVKWVCVGVPVWLLVALLFGLGARAATAVGERLGSTQIDTPSADASNAVGDAAGGVASMFGSLSGALDAVSTVMVSALWPFMMVWCGVLVVLAVVYAGATLYRWHYFERECLRNDWHSRSVKRRILRFGKMRKKYKELMATTKSKDGGRNIDVAKAAKIDAFRAYMAMDVSVHTRENVDTGLVERRYIVRVKYPQDADAQGELDSMLDKCASAFSRAVKRVSFSDGLLDDDFTFVEFVAADGSVNDKYEAARIKAENKYRKRNNIPEEDKLPQPSYDTSFPMSLFKDNSAEIERRRKLALKWATSRSEMITKILTTSRERANLRSIKVTSASVTFDYDVPFSLSGVSALDNYSSSIDRLLNVSNTMATMSDDNKLRFIVSLPNDLQVGIDNFSLFSQAFGSSVNIESKQVEEVSFGDDDGDDGDGAGKAA